MVVSKRWFEFGLQIELNRYPLLTSILPPFYLNFTSFSPLFLNPWFGEPVVCTLDSRGLRHFRGFRDFRESSAQLLVCSCLSCLRRFRRFRDFRRFRERRPVCQTIGLTNHRSRNARILTAFLPLFKPQLNLCFVGNLQPRFGNHGLHTLG